MKAFKRILIANRGEIACRIIRTLKAMQIKAVAVYSDADRFAQHVKLADEAYYLGPSPAKESYLDIEKILTIAQAHHIDAIHPGYGFLSENADFAQACAQAHIVFIGPPVQAIQKMGSKAAAKALMVEHHVPTLPGYFEKAQDANTLLAAAKKIKFPVLIKASYGGGGRGMRIVNAEKDFLEALAAAQREALNSFGNSEVIIEKYLIQPRHVEVQIFADQLHNTVYLFERDCSIQRRHQKVVEEAPAPNISESLRKQLGEAAVRAAKAIDYVGAGTIEFLLAQDGQFYFMEMNTRLQVEHPVTEKIVNEDLVAWQIQVAQGAALPKLQHQIQKHGAAIEVRLCAEDPYHQFLPATGKIEQFDYPKTLAHLRVDTGYAPGDKVSIYYDSLLAKVIAWGEDREMARRLLLQALAKMEVVGVKTNRIVLSHILQQQDFIDAKLSTDFIDCHEKALLAQATTDPKIIAIAALYWITQLEHAAVDTKDPWQRLLSFRLQQKPQLHFTLQDHHETYAIRCEKNMQTWQIFVGERCIIQEAYLVDVKEQAYQVALDNTVTEMMIWRQNETLFLQDQNQTYTLQKHSRFDDLEHAHEGENQFTAPMPGRIIACSVEVNESVQAGQTLLIMEAMKMEHTIRAPYDGIVTDVWCQAGDIVSEGAQLIEMAMQ